MKVSALTQHNVLKRLALYAGLGVFGLAVFLFVAFRFLHLSSNAAALYVLKDASGIRFASDVTFGEVDNIVFSLDATPLFNRFFEGAASAANAALLDTSYDEKKGRGVIKEFRPDGTRLEIALSRFDDDGAKPAGLIIGGDFPPGDAHFRREGGGMAFWDGSSWIHLWCTANEGIAAAGGGAVQEHFTWRYLGGKIIKRSFDEVILQSEHAVSLRGEPYRITRRLNKKAGDDFATLLIRITNTGTRAGFYDYAYGDEPWVGRFGSSEGEVGWHPDGFLFREAYVDPQRYSVIGFADTGNGEAGEPGPYTGYANFIQWIDTIPSQVYISNDFHSVGHGVLDSKDNRVLNIVWKNQYLVPGDSNTYVLRIGFIPKGEDIFASARRLAGLMTARN